MAGFDREIAQKNLREIIRQLVEQNVLNISHPVSGRTDPWAKFWYGHPDHCQQNQVSPIVFMYAPDFVSERAGVCTDRWTFNAVFGVRMWCDQYGGMVEEFDDLWFKIRRAFANDTWRYRLNASVSVTYSSGATKSFQNPTYSDLGIKNPGLSGSIPFRIDGGKILQYQSLFTCEVIFEAGLPEFESWPTIVPDLQGTSSMFVSNKLDILQAYGVVTGIYEMRPSQSVGYSVFAESLAMNIVPVSQLEIGTYYFRMRYKTTDGKFGPWSNELTVNIS